MDEPTRILFQQFGISLLLGMLVGLQREHSASVMAGLRTFPLVTVLGTLTAVLDRQFEAHGVLLAAVTLGLVGVVVVSNLAQLRRQPPSYGITTEAALLVMFAVGAYLVSGERIVAVAVAAGVAVLLQFKPELHGIAARLGDNDLRAIMQFALITCIVLPVLPNRTYGPLDVLNPFQIWLMVVLMVGISLGGYIIYKFFGQRAGILLGGILGGAISSTATTLSYARRSGQNPGAARLASVVIMIASTVVFARVLLEISVVAPGHVVELGLPVALMLTAGVVTVGLCWLGMRREPEEAMPEQANPSELKSAIFFGLLYAGVLFALAATKKYIGDPGLYGVAILSGLTDMDAITLSTGRLVEEGGLPADIGWRLIVVASIANLVFKAGLAGAIGRPRLLWRLALLFAVPAACGAALLAVGAFWM